MIPLSSAPRKKCRHAISCLSHSSRTHRSLYWRGSTLWLELFCWPSRKAQCSASLLAIRCRVTSRVCTSNSASGETTRFGTWSICSKVKQTRKTQANQAKHKKTQRNTRKSMFVKQVQVQRRFLPGSECLHQEQQRSAHNKSYMKRMQNKHQHT